MIEAKPEAREELRGVVRRLLGGKPQDPGELWKMLAGAGLLGLPFDTGPRAELPGFDSACIVIEELARQRIHSPYLTAVLLSGRAIDRFGGELQRKEYLPRIAAGELLVAYAAAEPEMMSGVSTPVARDDGTGRLLLSGESLFVPFAEAADKLLLPVRLAGAGGDRQHGLLLLDADEAGVSIHPLTTVDEDAYCRVAFDRVQVAGDRLLEKATSTDDADSRSILQWGAAARCCEMAAGCERVLEITLEYARRREQFGRPIGSFQAVQHRCADMAVDALSARLVTTEAVELLGRGLDAPVEVSVAKAWVGEAYSRICASGHQVHGAIGFTRGHIMHRFLRHARAASLDFGDPAYHRELLARRLHI